MKGLYKVAVPVIMALGIFNSCSSDSDQEEQPEEVAVAEELSKLKDDEQFLNYINQMLIVSDQILDADSAIEIIEKTEILSDQDFLILATALGFDSTDSMKEYLDSQMEDWTEIINRFDLVNQEEEEISRIYTEAVLKFIIQNSQKKFKNPEDWCIQTCYDWFNYSPNLNPPLDDMLQDRCDSSTSPDPGDPNSPSQEHIEWQSCYYKMLVRIHIQEYNRWKELDCCINSYCGSGGTEYECDI